MPASVYVTEMDFAENVYYLMNEVLPIFPVVQATLATEMVLNPVWALTNLTTDEKHETLRVLTAMTVALNSDLNCYPRGEAETLCFDLDGNPVP